MSASTRKTTLVPAMACLLVAVIVSAVMPVAAGASQRSPRLDRVHANAAGAVARTARRHFTVLRHRKTRKDVMRSPSRSRKARAKMAAMDSRLVFDGGREYKLYLVLQAPRICLSMIDEAHGSSGGTCADIADVVAGRQMLALGQMKPDSVQFAVAALDGSHGAKATGASGAERSLAINRNVIVDTLTERTTISFTDGGGRLLSTEFGPFSPLR